MLFEQPTKVRLYSTDGWSRLTTTTVQTDAEQVSLSLHSHVPVGGQCSIDHVSIASSSCWMGYGQQPSFGLMSNLQRPCPEQSLAPDQILPRQRCAVKVHSRSSRTGIGHATLMLTPLHRRYAGCREHASLAQTQHCANR